MGGRATVAILGGSNRRRNLGRLALPSPDGGIARGRGGAARAADLGRKFLQLVPGQNLIRLFPAGVRMNPPKWRPDNLGRILRRSAASELFLAPRARANPRTRALFPRFSGKYRN